MPLPNLLRSKEETSKRISLQIRRGREIREKTNSRFINRKDLELARAERVKWVDYVKALLESSFDSPSLANEFDPRGGFVSLEGVPTFPDEVQEFQESMDRYVLRLESIHERLDFIQEARIKPPLAGVVEIPRITPGSSKATPRIFSMTQLDDAERSRRSAKGRLDNGDYLGVFRDAENAVETAVTALLAFLDIEYKNDHDVSNKIPAAIHKLEERLDTPKFALVRGDLGRAAFWLHLLCASKDYFYGIKDVGIPAGDIFHPELGSLATACVKVTDIVVSRMNELIPELAYPSK